MCKARIKENISGYTCNHGSLSREQDTASSRGHYGRTPSVWPVSEAYIQKHHANGVPPLRPLEEAVRSFLKKGNDDSVSVEELDRSAESKVLIPAEHLWCDFKCRPWAKNSSPNTNEIWVQSFHTLQNRGGNNIFKYMNFFVATVWKCLFLF